MFKCANDNSVDIPVEVSSRYKDFYKRINTCGNFMGEISKEIELLKNDTWCKVPFCNTVESEALGAIIKLADENNTSRVSDYFIKNIDELSKITDIDFNSGRISEVLNSIEFLSLKGEDVVLMVEGPMTIATSLMDSSLFYKAYRKNKEEIIKFMELIKRNLIMYIKEGIKRGAKIISYADPVGNIDIVGPKVYKELSGKLTLEIVNELNEELEKSNVILHLCGRTSTSLEETNMARFNEVEVTENTYGEALKTFLKSDKSKVLGHWCVKRTSLKKADNKIIVMEL